MRSRCSSAALILVQRIKYTCMLSVRAFTPSFLLVHAMRRGLCAEGACMQASGRPQLTLKVRVSFSKFEELHATCKHVRSAFWAVTRWQDARKAPLAAVGLVALRHPSRVPAHQLVVHGNEPVHATRECEHLQTTSKWQRFPHLPHNADERGRARGCLTERPHPTPVLFIIWVPGSERSVCGIHRRRCNDAQHPRPSPSHLYIFARTERSYTS